MKIENEMMKMNQEIGEREWQLPLEKQEFDGDKEMYSIRTVDNYGKEGELVVSEKHRVYSYIDYSKYSNNSLVVKDLQDFLTSGSLKCGSLDHIGIFNSSANAKNGTSFLSDINFLALDRNLLEGSLTETNLEICSFTLLNESLEILDLEHIISEYLSSSSFNQSGLNNLILCSLIKSLVNESFLNNEKMMFVSPTSSIYSFLSFCNLLDKSSFTCSPNDKQSSSVNSECLNKSLSFSKASSLSFLSKSERNAFSNNFVKSDFDNNDNLSFNSSGIDIDNSAILDKRAEDLNNFRLIDVKDVYSDFNNSKNVWFLDKDNNPIKVTSIEKIPYDGKMYDVENDVVLVKRNGLEVWSGNSNNGTEILTDEGWKYFKDLDKNDKVLTLNQEIGEREWQLPLEKQEFPGEKEMFSIRTVDNYGKEGELVVSEKHRVYSSNLEDSFKNSLNSFVLNTLTSDCLLNAGSFDQIGQFSFNARAKYGVSFSDLCGESFCALSLNSLYSDELLISMNSFNSSKISLTSFGDDLVYLTKSGMFLDNSSRTCAGENNCKPNNSVFTIINLTGLSLKNEKRMFASTTNLIYQPSSLCFCQTRSLTSLPSLKQSSSVSLEFSNSLSNFLSNKALLTFSDKNFRTDSETLSSGSSSNCFFNSSDIDNVMLGILNNHVYSVKNVELYKSFSLQISEVYKNYQQEWELFSLLVLIALKNYRSYLK